jgi:hypothetical protein
MGHFYYTDLGTAAHVGVNAANQLPFKNILRGWYWSCPEYAVPGRAFGFSTADGGHANSVGGDNIYALAVRPGQLETSAVPEPSTYLLLGIALGVVGYARRRMSAR